MRRNQHSQIQTHLGNCNVNDVQILQTDTRKQELYERFLYNSYI